MIELLTTQEDQLGFFSRSGIAHEGGVCMSWYSEGGRLVICGAERVSGEGIRVLALIVAIEPDLDPVALARWREHALKLAWRDLQAAPEAPNDS